MSSAKRRRIVHSGDSNGFQLAGQDLPFRLQRQVVEYVDLNELVQLRFTSKQVKRLVDAHLEQTRNLYMFGPSPDLSALVARRCKQLVHLVIDKDKGGEPWIAKLIHANKSTLRTVRCEDTMDPKLIMPALVTCSRLTDVDLGYMTRVPTKTWSALAKACHNMGSIILPIDFQNFELFGFWPQLHTLSVDIGRRVDLVQVLRMASLHVPLLRDLELTFDLCREGDDEKPPCVVLPALKMSHLKRFRLECLYSSLGIASDKWSLPALEVMVMMCDEVKLDLDAPRLIRSTIQCDTAGANRLLASVSSSRQLESLAVDVNQKMENKTWTMTTGNWPNLRELSVLGAPCVGSKMMQICAHEYPNLQSVNMHVGISDMSHLVDLLTKCQKLESIGLTCDRKAKAPVDVKCNDPICLPRLEQLEITYPRPGMDKVLSLLQTPKLTRLKIVDKGEMSTSIEPWLASAAQTLADVSLMGVAPRVIGEWKTMLPRLRTLDLYRIAWSSHHAQCFLKACPNLNTLRLDAVPLDDEVMILRGSVSGLLPNVQKVWLSLQNKHSTDTLGCAMVHWKKLNFIETGGDMNTKAELQDTYRHAPSGSVPTRKCSVRFCVGHLREYLIPCIVPA